MRSYFFRSGHPNQVHFGDIVMDDKLLDLVAGPTEPNARAADTSVARWNTYPSGGKFLVPYSLASMTPFF